MRFPQATLPGLLFLGLSGHLSAQGTFLVTVTDNGDPLLVGGGSEEYRFSVSDDGRYVAFASTSWNLVPGDTNGAPDVFVKDLETWTTVRASVSSAGLQGDGSSYDPSISGDGRFVAFPSDATSLVASEPGRKGGLYVHDLHTRTTVRVPPVKIPGWGTVGSSWSVSLSRDGRRIAFIGETKPPGMQYRWDVYVHDLQTGQTMVASRGVHDSSSALRRVECKNPAISANGHFVSFDTTADHLVPDDLNRARDVFVFDIEAGVIERVSVNDQGEEGNSLSQNASLSADGRFVAFESAATNFAPGGAGIVDVYIRDRLLQTTERLNEERPFPHHAGSFLSPSIQSISADGRFVVFESSGGGLVPGDSNALTDVFVHDRLHGVMTRLSVDSAGNEAPWNDRPPIGAPWWQPVAFDPTISGDGQIVVFQSYNHDLVVGDRPGANDLFVRKRAPITLRQDYELFAGLPAQFAVLGAQPGEGVAFLYSRTGLERRCWPSLDACLDLRPPVGLLGRAVADPSGTATLTVAQLPSALAGRPLSTQAVLLRGPGRPRLLRSNTHHVWVQS